MKRKLALLLALIMVLSLIPANVMAANPAPGTGVSPQRSTPTGDEGARFTVTINVFDVLGALNSSVDREEVIIVSLGDARFLPTYDIYDGWNFGPSDPFHLASRRIVSSAALFVGTGTVQFDTTILNNTTAEVRLRNVTPTGAANPTNPQGHIIPTGIGGLAIPIPFYIRATHEDSRLSAYLHNIAPGRLLAQGPLTNFGTGVTVSYDGPDPVVFEWDAELDHIVITEQRLYALTANSQSGSAQHTIRLLAPVGYRWSLPPAGTTLLHHGAFQTLSFTGITTHIFNHPNGQQELVIRTTIGRSNTPALRDRLGVISIRNLVLVPDYDTRDEGELRVRVQVGNPYVNNPFGSYNAAGEWVPAGINFAPPVTGNDVAIRNWNNWWRNATGGEETLHVATRVRPRLTLSVVGDDLPQLRSGYAMGTASNRPLVITDQWWVPHTEAQMATTGRTAIMRIQENVVNALDLARGRPVTFEVPEGVIITGVEWRYYRGSSAAQSNQPYHRSWGVETGSEQTDIIRGPLAPLPHPDGQARGHGGRVSRPVPGQPQVTDVVFTDTTVTLRPWVTQHNQWIEVRDYTLRLEVRLHVSVAGGSEGRGLDELEVTVSGLGVSNLPQDGEANVIAVAEIYDPIYIEHHGDPAFVNMIGREQNINHTPAGALTITETSGGMLQRGTVLWLDVVEFYNIGHSLRISRYDVFTDAATGLGLMVRDITPAAIGTTTISRIQLEVTRETLSGGAGGTITFDGLTLFGHVYQGERYYLVVSGPAVAETFRPVWNNLTGTTNNVFSTFTSFPYYIEDIVVPVAEGTEIERADSLDGVTFETGVAFRGVANPIIWRRLPGMNHEGGFVSMRAFALAAGVTDDDVHINWAGRVATVSGFDYQGRWIVVSVSPDLATVTTTINGITTTNDIGVVTGGLTGGPGTVRPIHEGGTIYLPLRLMFDVFGYSEFYTLTRQGQRAVISAQ